MTNMLYKIFNKEKYKDIKISQKNDELKKIFFQKTEPKLKKIFNTLKKKKEISFLHSGHLGDIINSLPLIKEISKKKKTTLYIEINKILPKNISAKTHPSGKYYLKEDSVKKLMPLLKSINYISKVKIYNREIIDVNLNLFRELPINFNIDSVRWYFHLTGTHTDLSIPYFNIKKVNKFKNKIIIMRSLRRQNNFISYKFLNNYKNIVFVGLKNEYEDLKKVIKSLKYYESKDFLELAKIIKSCKLFIGNPSFGFALAEAVKCPRLLESGPNFPLIYPNGKNCYDFYFQTHFEYLFKKIYKI
jgi:hypothetical protein